MNRQLIAKAATAVLPLAVLPIATLAGSLTSHYGPSLTTGPSSNSASIFSAMHNPAMAALTVNPDERFRMSYFLSGHEKIELGAIDNFVDDLDELIDIIDDPGLAEGSIDETLARFNLVIEQMGTDGYLKTTTSFIAPAFPMYWRSDKFDGTFSAELVNDTQIRLSVLDSRLIYNEQNGGFDTGTSAYLKSGIETRAAVGFAKEIFPEEMQRDYKANLYLGIKLSAINLRLSKQVFWLMNLNGLDVDDIVEDEYNNNLETTTNIGLDVGLVWEAEKYRVGLTIMNLNQPSFEYGVIGEDCESRPEGSISRDNCNVAADFIQTKQEISAREEHTKHAVTSLDLTYYLKSNWLATAAFDLAAYDDIVGTQNQWMGFGTAYYPKNRWIPDMRAGFRKNLVGSNLASLNVGLTFFKSLNFDVEYALESITVDGSSGPRLLTLGMSVEEHF